MKSFRAILAAFAVTAIIGISMFVIGSNALANPNAGPVQNTPATTTTGSTTASSSVSAADNQQTSQLQDLVRQYQQREQQYQTELKQAAQKIDQSNQQLTQESQALQQYQQLLVALQQRGLIQITPDGQILLPSSSNSNVRSFSDGD